MNIDEIIDLFENKKINRKNLKEMLEKLEHQRDVCWYCGGKLCWDNDYDLSDITNNEEDEGIVTYLHCMNCNAQIEYLRDDKGNDFPY